MANGGNGGRVLLWALGILLGSAQAVGFMVIGQLTHRIGLNEDRIYGNRSTIVEVQERVNGMRSEVRDNREQLRLLIKENAARQEEMLKQLARIERTVKEIDADDAK